MFCQEQQERTGYAAQKYRLFDFKLSFSTQIRSNGNIDEAKKQSVSGPAKQSIQLEQERLHRLRQHKGVSVVKKADDKQDCGHRKDNAAVPVLFQKIHTQAGKNQRWEKPKVAANPAKYKITQYELCFPQKRFVLYYGGDEADYEVDKRPEQPELNKANNVVPKDFSFPGQCFRSVDLGKQKIGGAEKKEGNCDADDKKPDVCLVSKTEQGRTVNHDDTD